MRPISRIQARRLGSMFVETAIGISLSIVVMIAVAQLVAVIAYQRHQMAQRRLATRELANAMEHAMVISWSELKFEEPPTLKLSAAAEQRLVEPRLSVAIVNDQEGETSVKRLTVQIDWLNRAGQRVAPLRLVAWRHKPLNSTTDAP